VIASEQQAHGHTADIDRPLSFEQMADDTAVLLEQLGVHNADILGFSSGGMTALQLAIRHPALVRRLIICSGFYAHAGLVPTLRKGFAHASPANMPAPLRDGYLAAPHPEALPTFVAKTVAMMQTFDDIPEAAIRAIGAPTRSTRCSSPGSCHTVISRCCQARAMAPISAPRKQPGPEVRCRTSRWR
jgi:pimeloyl-ACP methyl ester carboxylesterase